MSGHRGRWSRWGCVLACWPALALGQGICGHVPQPPATYAARIAAVACAENALWYAPFIDARGRLASATVFEHERRTLLDGRTPAWRRVADYWAGSGLLAGMPAAGAADCQVPGDAGHLQSASCRAFLGDTPWSAAFVSWVMRQAAVPGFLASPSHIDYLRDAWEQPETSPYVLVDPDAAAPAMGDLLCYSRMPEPLGPAGLRSALATGSTNGMTMHCDIVVAANPGGDSRLYLVGGNVLQGVTMRVLPLNRAGRLWGLPRRMQVPAVCEPARDTDCSFHRQDWVAVLKLKPLPAPTTPMLPLPSAPAAQPACCTACPLPMPPGVKRCPGTRQPGPPVTDEE